MAMTSRNCLQQEHAPRVPSVRRFDHLSMGHLMQLIFSRANEQEYVQSSTTNTPIKVCSSNRQLFLAQVHPSSANTLSTPVKRCKCTLFNFSLPSIFTVHARSHKDFLNEKIKEYEEFFPRPDAKPIDRAKECFKDIFIGNTWEGKLVQQTFAASAFFGFIVGTLVRQKDRVEAFKKKFDHMQFEGNYQASRKLADVVLLSSLKFAGSLAMKFAFIPTFSMTAICCALAYRNSVNPLDFAVIAGSAGALYKINLGAKAMVSAGAVASALGLIAGSIVWSVFKLSGITVEEYRYWGSQYDKKVKADLSDKQWAKWAEKMKELKPLYEHDQLFKKSVASDNIVKEFDNIPDGLVEGTSREKTKTNVAPKP